MTPFAPPDPSDQSSVVVFVTQRSLDQRKLAIQKPPKPNELPLKSFHFYFGVVQMIIGELLFVTDIAALSAHVNLPAIGSGIFCGVLIFVSGLLSLLASKRNMRSLMKACLVTNVIATAACVLAIFFESWAVNVYEDLFEYYSRKTRRFQFGFGKSAFLLVIFSIEFFATIVHASLACKSLFDSRQPKVHPLTVLEPSTERY